MIADGDQEKARYILDWCAHMIQRPWEKPGVALVLKGRKGTGKTLLTAILARAVGQRNTLITDTGKHLFAKFNWHLADKVLIGAEEAFFTGHQGLNDRLKHLLTGADIEIEQKVGHRISMRSMHRMIMTSNHANVVDITDDERRFFVCEVSDKRRGDDSYFAPLWHVANGDDGATLAAFMHELMTRGITNWKPEQGARSSAALHVRGRSWWVAQTAGQGSEEVDPLACSRLRSLRDGEALASAHAPALRTVLSLPGKPSRLSQLL